MRICQHTLNRTSLVMGPQRVSWDCMKCGKLLIGETPITWNIGTFIFITSGDPEVVEIYGDEPW